MKSNKIFDNVCSLISEKYINSGWKYSKSGVLPMSILWGCTSNKPVVNLLSVLRGIQTSMWGYFTFIKKY